MSDAVQKNDGDDHVLERFKDVEDFCRVLLDGYALIDAEGKVLKCNQMFSQLTGKKTRQILRSNNLDELVTFYIRDSKLTLSEMLSYTSPIRIDEVRGDNGINPNLNLIIGIFPYMSRRNPALCVGAFVMVRDVTAETDLQGKYKTTAIKSITDPLTGLYTRGYFTDYLNLQMTAIQQQPADSEQAALTLALFDIDFFKRVNDDFGHQAGDHVLREVAAICQKSFRKTDFCCRYGGEEFLVILPTTSLQAALKPVEKFREAVERTEIVYEGKRIPVTISGGIAQVRTQFEDYLQTIARSDEALYAAKRGGRNQIQLHDGTAIRKIVIT